MSAGLASTIEKNNKLIEEKLATVEELAKSRSLFFTSKMEVQQRKEALIKENAELTARIEQLVKRLTELEQANNVNNEPFLKAPPPVSVTETPKEVPKVQEKKPETIKAAQNEPKTTDGNKNVKEKPAKKGGDSKTSQPAAGDDKVDVSRLDFRVGKIVEASKHPDADALYVEQIDVGEGKNRTVVSGLVKFVPLEEMQNRMVVCLCNLKPAKMRGVTSEAMVMCASTPDKVEVLNPPEGSVPGDRVTFPNYPGQPDGQLNPKKKIWETVAPDLKTDDNLVANYKGEPFTIAGKGVVKAQTLKNVQVK